MTTLTVNSNVYELKKDLTLGQMRKINKLFGESIHAEQLPDLTNLTAEEVIKLAPKIENQVKFNDQQLGLMSDLIKHSLDYTDEQMESIPFKDVENLWKEIIKENQPKKKSEQQYG